MCLAQNNDLLQALAPDRSDQPFGKAIARLPRIPQRSVAGVALHAGRKLAVELGNQRQMRAQEQLRTGGGQRGVVRNGRAEHGEAAAGQCLERRADRRRTGEVMRPGEAAVEDQRLAIGERRCRLSASAMGRPLFAGQCRRRATP